MVLDKDTLTEGVEQLRQNPKLGLVVLVNRYDGVDLPGDTCHVLVVDGLPEAMSGTERHRPSAAGRVRAADRATGAAPRAGHGARDRSNEDHCVVILLGTRLAERLYGSPAREASRPPPGRRWGCPRVAARLQAFRCRAAGGSAQCLGRDPEWLAISRSHAGSPCATAARRSSEVARRAVRRSASRPEAMYGAAVEAIQKAIDAASDSAEQGFSAAVRRVPAPGRTRPGSAVQKSANRLNRNLLRPRDGIVYEKLSAPALEQGAAASCRTAGDR